MYRGVSCRYVPVFGSNEVPDPVRALFAPTTSVRGIQIQNRFGLFLVNFYCGFDYCGF